MKYISCPHANDGISPHTNHIIMRRCGHTDSPHHNSLPTPNNCRRCRFRELGTSANEVPTLPSLPKRLLSYAEAVANWIVMGKPERSDEEVKDIYERLCNPCTWRNKQTDVCSGCGCRVAHEGVAVMNKIKMATEHCPRNKW